MLTKQMITCYWKRIKKMSRSTIKIDIYTQYIENSVIMRLIIIHIYTITEFVLHSNNNSALYKYLLQTSCRFQKYTKFNRGYQFLNSVNWTLASYRSRSIAQSAVHNYDLLPIHSCMHNLLPSTKSPSTKSNRRSICVLIKRLHSKLRLAVQCISASSDWTQCLGF